MENNILIKQNEQRELERLAAQRELYSAAKRKFFLQTFLTVLIPVIITFIGIFNKILTPYSAFYGICIFVIDLIFLEPYIKRKKSKAAKAQELFDCSVLSLEHSPLKVVNDITVEEVLQHYEAHQKIATNIEKIRNWYPHAVSEVNIAYARIICQRSSCWWDKALRDKYCNIIQTISVITPLSIFAICFFQNTSITQFVLILSTLVPFFRFSIKYYNENRDMNCRLERLSNYINLLWNNIIEKSLQPPELEVEARRIQDAIYDNRTQSPLIFDFFYKLSRSKDELTMNKAAEILVNQIKSEVVTSN